MLSCDTTQRHILCTVFSEACGAPNSARSEDSANLATKLRSMRNIAAAGGRLIGSLAYILAVLGRGTGPKREEMAGRSQGTDSQDLATILDSFRTIFDDLGPDRLSAT